MNYRSKTHWEWHWNSDSYSANYIWLQVNDLPGECLFVCIENSLLIKMKITTSRMKSTEGIIC